MPTSKFKSFKNIQKSFKNHSKINKKTHLNINLIHFILIFNRFFTINNNIKVATPMFLCLLCVELSDIMFALDSVPAVSYLLLFIHFLFIFYSFFLHFLFNLVI